MTLDEIAAKIDAIDAKLTRLDNIESHLLDLLLPHRRANPGYNPALHSAPLTVHDASFPHTPEASAPQPVPKPKPKPKKKGKR